MHSLRRLDLLFISEDYTNGSWFYVQLFNSLNQKLLHVYPSTGKQPINTIFMPSVFIPPLQIMDNFYVFHLIKSRGFSFSMCYTRVSLCILFLQFSATNIPWIYADAYVFVMISCLVTNGWTKCYIWVKTVQYACYLISLMLYQLFIPNDF